MAKKRLEDDGYGVVLTCDCCGREFWVSSLTLYAYKLGYNKHTFKYYCCYKCYRKDGN